MKPTSHVRIAPPPRPAAAVILCQGAGHSEGLVLSSVDAIRVEQRCTLNTSRRALPSLSAAASLAATGKAGCCLVTRWLCVTMGCCSSQPKPMSHVVFDAQHRALSRGFVRVQPGLWRCQLPLAQPSTVFAKKSYSTVACFLIAPEAVQQEDDASQPAVIDEPAVSQGIRGSAAEQPESVDPLHPSHKRPPREHAGSLRRLLPPPLPQGSFAPREGKPSSEVAGKRGWTLVDTGPWAYSEMVLGFVEHVLTGSAFPTLSRVLITHPHEDHIGGLPALLRRYPAITVHCHPLAMPLLVRRSASSRRGAAFGTDELSHSCTRGVGSPSFVVAAASRSQGLSPFQPVHGRRAGLVGHKWLHALRDREPCGATDQTGRNVIALYTPGHSKMCVSFMHRTSQSLLCGDVLHNRAALVVLPSRRDSIGSVLGSPKTAPTVPSPGSAMLIASPSPQRPSPQRRTSTTRRVTFDSPYNPDVNHGEDTAATYDTRGVTYLASLRGSAIRVAPMTATAPSRSRTLESLPESARLAPAELSIGCPCTSFRGSHRDLHHSVMRINNTHYRVLYPSHDSQCGVDCADVGRFVATQLAAGPSSERSSLSEPLAE